MSHDPTPEQGAALDLFRFGDNLAIEAGAGTGKTTTLRMIASDAAPRTGQYVAFNRSIVLEAQRTMPDNVAANTMHSLAMRAIGFRYSGRLRSSTRQRGDQVARFLGLDPLVLTFGTQRKVLQPAFLAGLVQRAVTIYCQTADDEPSRKHVPYVEGIDLPGVDGRRGWRNNDHVRDHIADALPKAWADLQKVDDGRLRFRHEHYLKMWQLSHPTLPVDFLMCDEAQDTSPVMLDVVARQTHAQLVFVGDSQQQIYEFTGAVNAMAKVPSSQRVLLTQSFRFGHEIAARANHVLTEIGADLRLRGLDSIASTVGPVASPRCVLTRTNATAMNQVLSRQKAGQHVHLIGGGTEVLSFAKAAAELMDGRTTWHPELACFTTWGEVQAYVESDPQGSELALLVTLVDTYGVGTIVAALENQVPEEAADVVVSTAHKSKGREWESVQLADDFPDPRQSFDALVDPAAALPELRLIYVAATRARERLDVTRVPLFDPLPTPGRPVEVRP
mgnify:CR=1 FL=1